MTDPTQTTLPIRMVGADRGSLESYSDLCRAATERRVRARSEADPVRRDQLHRQADELLDAARRVAPSSAATPSRRVP